MSTTPLRHRLLPRALGATLLLAALLLGALAHGWHHFADHDCGKPGSHHADACAVCSTLHAAPMPELAAAPALPTVDDLRPLHAAAALAPRARARATAPARAPPIA